MGDMIERMARAMCRLAEQQASTDEGPAYEALGYKTIAAWVDGVWPNYVPAARVALQAVIETPGVRAAEIYGLMVDALNTQSHNN